jgi:uncharacterized damage-inducible protein DinB
MAPEIRLLLDNLDHAFGGRGWHGTTLTGALRGVSPARALWRPQRNRHSIWELALHAAYWKYAVRCRVTGERPPGGFARTPSNWPAVPARADAKQWRADLRLLTQMHADLRAAVATLPPGRLRARSPAGTWSYADMIVGVAAHDVYHTGQIQYIKRLADGR